MDYQWHYEKLIETRKNRIFEKDDVYEIHHIIPKSLGGEDIEENKIKLTPREHFLAHWLLWRIHRNREMSFAFFSMCQYRKGNRKQFKISARGYEEARISRKLTGISDETREKMSLAKRGKRKSDEVKMKMSLAKKGSSPWNKGKIGISLETREKMSIRAQHRGRKHLSFFISVFESNLELEDTQKNILKLYIDGKSDIEISRALFMEIYDVKNALRSIRTKFEKIQKNSHASSY
jgi:hypothetical protein